MPSACPSDGHIDIRAQVVQLSWGTITPTPTSAAGQRTITLDADTVRVLRHGAASLALAAGTDVRAVPVELGHSTTHFTQDTRRTVFPDVAEAAAEAAAEATAALLRGTPARSGGLVPVR